jgi:hypothetical protein
MHEATIGITGATNDWFIVDIETGVDEDGAASGFVKA